ncbi:MAG: hypothetical protein IOD12_16520 [Silvanigrellales bacterium]|nr:hypothetical protein [Silvanigrellales bacterium]
MPELIVLIPVYQELEWINGTFESQWNFLHDLPETVFSKVLFRFCVWSPSLDTPVLRALQNAISKWPKRARREVVWGSTGEPSVVGSLRLGFEPDAPRAFLLLCPVDCTPGPRGLQEAIAFAHNGLPRGALAHEPLELSKDTYQWALFPKSYDRGGLMRLSALIQNTLVLPFLGAACWTNLFVVSSEAFDAHFSRGFFLEDLRANGALRKSLGKPYRFQSKALVSARRYAKRGPLRQMATNVFIFVRYLLGRFDEGALRRVHEGRAFASETPKGSD